MVFESLLGLKLVIQQESFIQLGSQLVTNLLIDEALQNQPVI